MQHIAIFASGGGSNAKVLAAYFKNHSNIAVSLLLSNNPESGIFQIGKEYNIPTCLVTKQQFNDITYIREILEKYHTDYIALAGFLWLIPEFLIECYPDKIVNIHPSLLPGYGGKGMYGMHVHNAVFKNKDQVSGMTIHLVNQEYDKGKILYQHQADISACRSAEDIAHEVLKFEHKYYAPVLEKYILNGHSFSATSH